MPIATYPVGTIITTVDSEFSPSAVYGGTWEPFGQGKVLVGFDESDSDFNWVKKEEDGETAFNTGGEKSHTLSVDEMPKHSHSYGEPRYTGGDWSCLGEPCDMNISLDPTHDLVFHGYTFSTGGSQAHNNLQPYIVVYRWRRVV